MSTLVFLGASLAATAVVAAAAAAFRSRAYATYRAIMLTVFSLASAGLLSAFARVWPAYLYLHSVVYVQALLLIRPRMMPLAYRALVSIPASFFAAGTLLGWPWAVLFAVGFEPWAPWLPYAVAFFGVLQSLSTRSEEVDLVVRDGHAGNEVRRYPPGDELTQRPLRIVQLTDTHLGPFMSVGRLRRIAQRAAAREPDLVFLTGDFLTMESQGDPDLLARALEPLAALRGRVFACMGNHDHEAPETVSEALARIGARLLVDDSTVVQTAVGRVRILGIDFRWRGRRRHIAAVCAQHPRPPGVLSIVLLHDPSAFRHVPEGDADLVLSGHTHGGQVGLVSLGLSVTMLRLFVKSPDHGFWALGPNRLYVHRGTGHYGFPLRVGVPAEESLLRVHVAAPVGQLSAGGTA